MSRRVWESLIVCSVMSSYPWLRRGSQSRVLELHVCSEGSQLCLWCFFASVSKKNALGFVVPSVHRVSSSPLNCDKAFSSRAVGSSADPGPLPPPLHLIRIRAGCCVWQLHKGRPSAPNAISPQPVCPIARLSHHWPELFCYSPRILSATAIST